MPSLRCTRKLATTAALAFVAFGFASNAQARTEVFLSIGIQMPGTYIYATPIHRPPPVYIYVQPQPVYVQPAWGYHYPPPVFVQPRPVFMQPPMHSPFYGGGPGWQRAQWERVQPHGHHWHHWHHGQRGQGGHRGQGGRH